VCRGRQGNPASITSSRPVPSHRIKATAHARARAPHAAARRRPSALAQRRTALGRCRWAFFVHRQAGGAARRWPARRGTASGARCVRHHAASRVWWTDTHFSGDADGSHYLKATQTPHTTHGAWESEGSAPGAPSAVHHSRTQRGPQPAQRVACAQTRLPKKGDQAAAVQTPNQP